MNFSYINNLRLNKIFKHLKSGLLKIGFQMVKIQDGGLKFNFIAFHPTIISGPNFLSVEHYTGLEPVFNSPHLKPCP